jgi:hypothetical protein
MGRVFRFSWSLVTLGAGFYASVPYCYSAQPTGNKAHFVTMPANGGA